MDSEFKPQQKSSMVSALTRHEKWYKDFDEKSIYGICLGMVLSLTLLMSDSQAGLIFGSGAANRALGHNYPSVGWVDITSTSLGVTNAFSGSGVLIDPHWVLTSGHVTRFTATNPSTTYDSFRVGFGNNYLTNPGQAFTASELFVNPTFTDVAKGYDLALLYFENPITNLTPVNRYFGDIAIGDDASIVGFGRLQDVNDPTHTQTFTGDRYAGNNAIDSLTDPLRPGYIGTSLYNNTLHPFYRPNQMGGRPGDSGGALIINGELAGITSRAVGDTRFAITQYSLLDNSWIDSTIASKTIAIPEPTSLILLSAAGGFLFRRKRSRIKT